LLPGSHKSDDAGPTNNSVLLPPQTFDGPGKTANNTREHYGAWSLSGGAYLIQPIFNTNSAFSISSGGGKVSRQLDFSHDLEAGPDVWLSYAHERGWGVRGRWFQFDHDASASYIAAAGETIRGITSLTSGQAAIAGSVDANSNLAVNVFDIQWTCAKEGPRWSCLVGFGVRYAHMSQDYRATLQSLGTRIDLTAGHNFNGWGPTLSAEVKRRIRESGFSVFGVAHGAVIFGDADESYAALNNAVPETLARNHTDVLPVWELETGLEYQRNFGRARAFAQAAFVGQVWLGGGNASNLDAIAFTSPADNNFGFLGLILRAGVRY
jgi:hypothetical protein